MTLEKTVNLPLHLNVLGEFPSVLVLDPGGTTGYAYFNHKENEVTCGQIGPDEHHGRLYGFLNNNDIEQIVCESFEFRQFSGFEKAKVELWSKEYIGIVKLFCVLQSVNLVFQTASQAKRFISDEKLKRLDWYKPTAGMVHARDALRHMLYYVVVTRKIREPFASKWLRKE